MNSECGALTRKRPAARSLLASCLLGAALTMVVTALTLRWMLRVTGTQNDHE